MCSVLRTTVIVCAGHQTFWSSMLARKGHYGQLLSHLHLKGIGGPGAPHVFRLERLRDTGWGGTRDNDNAPEKQNSLNTPCPLPHSFSRTCLRRLELQVLAQAAGTAQRFRCDTEDPQPLQPKNNSKFFCGHSLSYYPNPTVCKVSSIVAVTCDFH